ncbi:MAG: hypothetical protein GOP50_04365 [Candidatus Heimdallarchaeota archaeon]|nr:hypothetical protein [Candidatus Heimdallarchaeota archaeon]
MLTFVIVSSTIRKDSKKTIKSVVGGQERFDVLARCLLNLDRWKERIEHDLNLIIYLSHPEEQISLNIPLKMLPSTLNGELDSVFGLINIFSKPELSNSKFINIEFGDLMEDLSKSATIYYLNPDGDPLTKLSEQLDKDTNMCFVLGSQHDLSEIQEQVLYKIKAHHVSLGEQDYLASHVITTICYQFLP